MKLHYRFVITSVALLATVLNGMLCQAMQTTESQSDVSPTHPSKSKFIRLQTDEYNNPIALQTATTRYVLVDENGDEQLEVILESVIHIADSSYYRSFQNRFPRYDSVLYESLLKQENKPSEEPEQPSGFQLLQQLSTGTIGLVYQFDVVDYHAENMLHSDLSPDEITAQMQQRGENATTLFSDLVTHIFQSLKGSDEAQANDVSEDKNENTSRQSVKLSLSVFTDPNGIMKLRRAMAVALVGSGLLESPLPPGIHRMIIGDRNDHAMTVLDAEIKKDRRRIAIFFGVGHMTDFEQRLTTEYGMKKTSTNWRNAWDLRDGAIEGAPLEGLVESAFRDSVKEKLAMFAKRAGRKKSAVLTDEKASPLTDEAAMKKSREVEEMELKLKILEARLLEFEKQSGKEKSDKAKDETETEEDKEIDQDADKENQHSVPD